MLITVSTGCDSLDLLLGGGFQEGSATLIRGGAGTGKTTLAVQFLVEGANVNNEVGLYIICEEDPLRMLGQFDKLKLGDLVKKGQIIILDLAQARIGVTRNYLSPNIVHCPEADLNPALLYIFELIEEKKIKRVVLDSIEAFMTFAIREVIPTRDVLFRIIEYCRREGVTSLLISEKQEKTNQLRAEPFEEHMVDGVIILGREFIGKEATRTLQIQKMRGSEHDSRIHPIRITDSGIELILPRIRKPRRKTTSKTVFGMQDLDAFLPMSQEGIILLETDSQSFHWRSLVIKFMHEGFRNNEPIIYLISGKESRQIAEEFLENMKSSREREKVHETRYLTIIDALRNSRYQELIKSTGSPDYVRYLNTKIPHDLQSNYKLILSIEKDLRDQYRFSKESNLLREVEILSERALELGETNLLRYLNSYYFQLLSRRLLCLGILNTEIHSSKFTKTIEFLADVIIQTRNKEGQDLIQVIKSPWGQSRLFVMGSTAEALLKPI
ncbi:MAG: RAD55 family ATPase [Candidatus Heimdallarchaeota archaeon]